MTFKRPPGSKHWIKDALSGQEGFERQFIEYVTPEWLNQNRGTRLEMIRRMEFKNLLDFCNNQPEYH